MKENGSVVYVAGEYKVVEVFQVFPMGEPSKGLIGYRVQGPTSSGEYIEQSLEKAKQTADELNRDR